MQVKSTLAFFIFSLTIITLSAQVAKDATVPITAFVSTNPASVTLNWLNPAAANLLVQRRTKGQGGNSWIQLLNAPNSTQTSLTDNAVAVGQTYEYVIQRVTNINAFGYAHVALEAPVTDSRGKVILFVDADIAAPLAPELERLKNDLVGDGWQIIEHVIDAAATVQTVKNQIVADYNADPANVKSVFLLGKIPVPYSGNAAWDGHSPDHTGAWPCDAFYADLDGIWTDASVNNTLPDRAANDNVPGDGKFDQNFIPTAVELQVGRVDFRRLTQGTFGAPTVELLRRYLDKNHNWRTGVYTVENKAIVDDNFGYFSGEAFAANGFRNAYPLVGEGNVEEADFFNNTNPQTYLLGYGTGGGSYTSAGGVGSSANFATDTVNIVFSNLFGSYHGDWDFETNPFMPAALASRGGILTCAWAGRPHHFYQALASGETIGFCIKETQNAQYNNGFFASLGESGTHVALLGDPTIRAHIVTPPTDLTAISGCGNIELNWAESPDAGISGYHIYRSLEKHGAYTRLTTNAINSTSFTDHNILADTVHYQIRAVKSQTSPGGGTYWNTSTGAMLTAIYTPPASPQVSINNTGGTVTCLNPQVPLAAVSNPSGVSFQWAGPNNYSSTNSNAVAEIGGIYSVTVTFANGCTNKAQTTVFQDLTPPPPPVVTVSNIITCNQPAVIAVQPIPGFGCSLYDPNDVFLPNCSYTTSWPGAYTVILANPINGCTSTTTVLVEANFATPLAFGIGGIITCDQPAAPLIVAWAPTPQVPSATFDWSGPCLDPNGYACAPGVYTLIATNPDNGCTVADTALVTIDTAVFDFNIPHQFDINCTNICASLNLPDTSDFEFYLNGQLLPPDEPASLCFAGVSTLTVKSLTNGCTTDYPITVTEDINQPGASIEGGGLLTCDAPQIALTGNSPASGVIYDWSGPNGFHSTQQTVMATVIGTYSLTVTNPVNGCTSTASIAIQSDGSIPDISAEGGTITCINPTVQLDGESDTPGVTFFWTGPGGFASSEEDPTVSTAGIYTLTVSAPNGCSVQATATVLQAITEILIDAMVADESAPGANDGSIGLGLMGNSPFDFMWSNGATTQSISNIPAGTYTVTITDATGCVVVAEFVVQTTSGTEESAVFQHLLLSPNPTDGAALLSMQLHKTVAIRVTVCDATGHLIYEKPEIIASELALPIDLRKNPPGMYTVFIFVEKQVFARKLAVVR